jgi:hypothetical protein
VSKTLDWIAIFICVAWMVPVVIIAMPLVWAYERVFDAELKSFFQRRS